MAETKAAASPHDFAELGNVGLVDADLLNFQQHGLDYLYDLEPLRITYSGQATFQTMMIQQVQIQVIKPKIHVLLIMHSTAYAL